MYDVIVEMNKKGEFIPFFPHTRVRYRYLYIRFIPPQAGQGSTAGRALIPVLEHSYPTSLNRGVKSGYNRPLMISSNQNRSQVTKAKYEEKKINQKITRHKIRTLSKKQRERKYRTVLE